MKYAISFVLCLSLSLSGCIGSQFLKVQRYKYNEAIQESTAEQLLLNIVRLRYNDSPMFLNVGDIDARFSLEASSMASGTINENVGVDPLKANSATVTASSGFTNNPNIKLSPMQDADFARLLEPLTLDEMLALGKRRVYLYEYLALTMQGYTYTPPEDGDKEITVDAHRDPSKWKTFLERLKVDDEKGRIVIGNEMVETEELLPSYPASEIEPGDVIEAKLAGLMFKKKKKPKEQKPKEQKPEKQKPENKKDEEEYVLVGKTRKWTMKVRAWVVDPRLTKDRDMTRLQKAQESVRSKMETARTSESPPDITKLQEAKASLRAIEKTIREQLASVQLAPKDEDERKAEIDLRSRSIVQMMYCLSLGVKVPSPHESERNGPPAKSRILDFVVEHKALPPIDPFVSVKYRGYWFYIDRSKAESKKFLSVLTELFIERAGKPATTATTLAL